MRALGAAVHVRVVPVWRRLESAVADRIPCAARRGVGADDSGLAGPAAVAVSTGEKGGRTGDLVDDHAGRADLRTDPWRLHLRQLFVAVDLLHQHTGRDRKSTRLNSSH